MLPNQLLKFLDHSLVILIVLSLLINLTGCTTQSEMGEKMQQEQQKIEAIRIQYESQIMAINGVVFVSNGICYNGKPCLKIGTSIPINEVRLALPDGLFEIDVDLDYVGKIQP